MLSCVQRILGGARHVNDRYSSEEFREFRDENLVQLAVQYARVSAYTVQLHCWTYGTVAQSECLYNYTVVHTVQLPSISACAICCTVLYCMSMYMPTYIMYVRMQLN